MSTFKGMDPTVVRTVAAQLKGQSDLLGAVATNVDGLVQEATQYWDGEDLHSFVSYWQVQYRPLLLQAQGAVAELGQTALKNADEQEAVSGEGNEGEGRGDLGTGSADWTGGSLAGALAGIGVGFDVLSAGLGSLEIAAERVWKSEVGRLARRGPDGRFTSMRQLDPLAFAIDDPRNWVPKPGQGDAFQRWQQVNRWAKRAGFVSDFASGAFSQWAKDAADPSMSTAERIGRAGTMGATQAGGGWAGAWVGTGTGAAIGSVFPGPGTAVGAVVGGVVGGVIGSEVGEKLGDALVGPVGDATDAVVDVVGEGLAEIGDKASDVGDKLTFWN